MKSWIRSSTILHLKWWRTTLWWITHIYPAQWWITANPLSCAKVNILLSLIFLFGFLWTTLKWGLALQSLSSYLSSFGINFLSFSFLFFFFFWAAPTAYGGSQARGQIRAAATGLAHSHSNARSKLHLQPTPQLMAMPDP